MIELKKSIGVLDPAGLKALVDTQRGRRDRITAEVETATKTIAARRKAIVVPDVGDPRRVGVSDVRVRTSADAALGQSLRSHAERQAVDDIRLIREATDKLVVPVMKLMIADSGRAQEMAQWTHDKLSILRRTKGPYSGPGSFDQAMETRERYRTILRDVESIELFRWAQWCVDASDPASLLTADAVLRENFTRPKDKRSFLNFTLLDLLVVPEFDEAQAQLNQIILLAKEAGTRYAQFGRDVGAASTLRISLGLSMQGMKLDASGLPTAGAEE